MNDKTKGNNHPEVKNTKNICDVSPKTKTTKDVCDKLPKEKEPGPHKKNHKT